MKKTLIALLALVGATAPSVAATFSDGQPITLTLPSSTNIGSSDYLSGGVCSNQTSEAIVSTLKGKESGVYIGPCNAKSFTNWGANGEGTWTCDNNVGSVVLAGRNGASGEGFGLVVKASAISSIEPGTYIDALTFSFSVPTSTGFTLKDDANCKLYKYTIAVLDTDGNTVVISSDEASAVRSSAADLSITTGAFTWQNDYTIIAAIKGFSADPATETYTISNIQLTATPEPATATLSLLALAALASRRKRH